MSKKFVLHIAGPSCVGKSTVTRLLSGKISGAYTLSYDKQKFQLSGYDRDKHGLLVKNIIFDFFKAITQYNIPVFLDFPLRNEEDYRKYKEYAEKMGYEFIQFVLTASQEVLIGRYRERLENSQRTGAKLVVHNEDMFLKQLEKEFFVSPQATSFDTASIPPETIVEKIINLLD